MSDVFVYIAKADDPVLCETLKKYHRENLSNNGKISKRLKNKYNINMRYVYYTLLLIRY
jgi:hypothetical protein